MTKYLREYLRVPTLEEALQLGLAEEVVTDIAAGVEYRMSAAEFDAQAKDHKAKGDEILGPAMVIAEMATGSKSIRAHGKVITLVDGSRSTLNKDKLKKELLRLGVAVGVIAEAVERATTVSEYVSIRMAEDKPEGGQE